MSQDCLIEECAHGIENPNVDAVCDQEEKVSWICYQALYRLVIVGGSWC